MKEELKVWGTSEVVLSAPTSLEVKSVSSGNDFSLSMDNFTLQLNPDIGPTSLTQIISFRVPLTIASNQQLIGYKQTLLFGLQRTPGVRVLIMADLAGTVKTIEFDFTDEIPPDGQVIAQKAISIFSVQGLELDIGLDGAVADYTATVSITIQRRTLKASGLINVDNLDVRSILCSEIMH